MKYIVIPRIAYVIDGIPPRDSKGSYKELGYVEGLCLHDISDMVQPERKYGHINETLWEELSADFKDMIKDGKSVYVKSLIGVATSANPLGRLPEPTEKIEVVTPKDRHVGNSDYSTKSIQPYDIWTEYELDPFRADLIKRILRTKSEEGMTLREAKLLDLKKMAHVIETMIHRYETNNFLWDGVDKNE